MNQKASEDSRCLTVASFRRQAFISVAAFAAVFTSATGLSAQDDDVEGDIITLEEFVVTTGIRDSLAAGIEVRQNSIQAIDAIFAEDIGKFPDNNVVEALQRVAGVQVTQRERGEVNAVAIRGLGDVTTTINGRNIFTASGRSVALADIPASLLNRVDIYKTRSASLIEHGIAGVIDVQTHRPFDFGTQRTVLAARGIYNELRGSMDPNLSALVSNVWETKNGRFGALINVSFAETNWTDKSVTAGAMVPFLSENAPDGWVPLERVWPSDWRASENPIWQAGLEAGLPFSSGSTFAINGEQVPYYLSRDALFSADFYGHRERPAVNISLQFAPDQKSTYTFEAFYNGYREDWNNNLLFTFADWWGSIENPASSFELFPGTNIIKSRTLGYPFGFMSGDKTDQETDSFLYSLTGEWEIGESLNLTADLSYQKSEFETRFLAMQTNRVARSITADFNSGNGIPAWSHGDDPNTADIDESDLTDARLWNIGPFFDNAGRNEGEALSFTLDGDYDTGWDLFNNIKFGIRFDDRDAEEGSRTGFGPDLNQPLADYPELQHVNSGYFDGRADIPQSAMVASADYLAAEPDAVRSLYGLPLEDELSIATNFKINETNYAAYVQTDFRQELGGDMVLSGQLGARYVKVDTDLDFISDTDETSTDAFLPSLAMVLDFNKNWRLRASYGETLRRPNFVDLNPNITYVDDVTNIGYGTASGGNPDLQPTESKNYDISLEYYFGDASALYVTAFKREVDGLVVPFRKRVNYDNYDYILTQPDNTSNGTLDGWEFGLVYFPEDLPDWLDGIGMQASLTLLDSIQDIPITNDVGEVVGTDTTPFFGVSDTSYSVVLAYEKPKYSVRLSHVWRDDFLQRYEAALFANPLGIYNTAEKSLDLQITYKVNDNFVLTFDATNLTDEVYHSYYEYPGTHNFGNWLISRTFAVGARYSF